MDIREFSRSNKWPGAGCVRVGPIAAIPDLLHAHASETPEQILAEVDIDLALFDDPENTIPYVKGGQLLDLCAKRTGIPHFGLLVGQLAGPNAIGRLSAFAIHSPDAGSALHNIILHLCIHDRGGIPTLTTNNATTTFGFTIYQAMQGGASQIQMCSIAVISSITRALCGESWVPSQVLFSHAQPEDIQPYTSLFKVKPVFNSNMNALIFPDRWLQKSIPGADPQQYRALVEELTTVKAQVDTDLLEQIRSLMYPLVVSGKCTESQLAQILSMHPRTLNRRLKERETTFRSYTLRDFEAIAGRKRYIDSRNLDDSRLRRCEYIHPCFSALVGGCAEFVAKTKHGNGGANSQSLRPNNLISPNFRLQMMD